MRRAIEALEARAAELEREVETLRGSADRFRMVFEFAPDAYYLSDLRGVFVDGNQAAEALSGYARKELVGKSFLELGLLPSSQLPKAAKLLALNALGKRTGPDAFTLCRKNGESVDVEISTVPIQMDGETRVLGIARDVTARTRIVARLRESEERYQRAANAGRVGVWEWDLRTNEMYLDRELKALLGYEEHEIENHLDDWGQHVHPDDVDKVTEATTPCLDGRASSFDVEHRMIHKDGSIRWFLGRGTVIRDDDGAPVRIVGSDVDVTEHKRSEEQRSRLEAQTRLLQAQKLESLGVLAGGVAHDFNNMLTAILGSASLALKKLDAGAPVRRLLERIEQGAIQASELTNQLLAYSGKGRFLVEPIGLNQLVLEMVHFLEMSISKKARLKLELSDDEPVIEADASQFRQVIMNLVLNASESVHAAGGGVVTVATSSGRVVGRPDEASQREGPSPGLYAVLEVTDTGEGMEEERLSQIFEPFFTTKSHGRGLGLAAVQGIVRGHGGTVEIESEPGSGTRVVVRIPCTTESPPGKGADSPVYEVPEREPPTVLVVDDEPSVRDVSTQILEDAGFRVITADNGTTAVQVFDERSIEISIVLLDLTMPDIDGDVVIERIRAIRSEAPVVLMSGYDEQRSLHPRGGLGANGFVKKPFHPRALVGELQRCLYSDAREMAVNRPRC